MASAPPHPQPLRPRHVPQRTCVGCRTQQPKRQLIRIVRTPAGAVLVDPSGRQAGRGAYLHLNPDCWNQGLKKGKLAKALHVTISAEDQPALEQFIQEASHGT
jgi:predicted RNA-binding protein YlxR (DUF448 family)